MCRTVPGPKGLWPSAISAANSREAVWFWVGLQTLTASARTSAQHAIGSMLVWARYGNSYTASSRVAEAARAPSASPTAFAGLPEQT